MAHTPKFDRQEFDKRQQARQRAQQNANENSVPALREAVRDLEQATGVKQPQ